MHSLLPTNVSIFGQNNVYGLEVFALSNFTREIRSREISGGLSAVLFIVREDVKIGTETEQIDEDYPISSPMVNLLAVSYLVV